jgi:hypothetical protein
VLSSTLLPRARRAARAAAPARAALTISAIALATAGLAACSSSSAPAASSSSAPAAGSASSSAPAASSPGASSPAASSAPGPAAARGPDVCSVLTSTRVASITGDSAGQVTRGQAGTSSTCSYSLRNGTLSIEVEVAPRGSSAGYAGFSGLVTAGASPPGSAASEPGLGQQALASSFGVAVQGARYAYLVINAHGQVSDPLGTDLKMARVMVSTLG